MTIADTLRDAAAILCVTSDTPRLDAELLMAHAFGISRSDLLLRYRTESVPETFAALLSRRQNHEPVAYILGEQAFYGLTFRVTPDVLIPRGDSEVLVETALKVKPDAQSALDCGTGSGALLLAVLANLADAEGIGMDRSASALAIARENAVQLGLDKRVRMVEADWTKTGWADDLGQFELILANPPYVETDADLAPSVRNHEPAGALFAGEDGLDAYHVLIPQLPALLAPDGLALVEIGATQARSVTALAEAAGLSARLHNDLANRPRVVELGMM